VGGRLYLTDERLLFEPNRADAVGKGESWSTGLQAIREVGKEMPNGKRFEGGLRTRLRLDLQDGTYQRFVVKDLESVVQTLRRAADPS